MLEIITGLTGIIIGIITGITPGLHPNTIMPLLLILLSSIEPLSFAILLISMMITTNFFEFIKTTYLSCPGEGEALSLKYVQKLLIRGRGKEAIRLLSIGALTATLITAITVPLIKELIPIIYKKIEDYVAVILTLLSFNMILKERNKIGKAIIITILSGMLGVLVLRTEIINQPLLPLLTGMYGLSNIIKNISIKEEIPQQMKKLVTEIDKKTVIKGALKAAMSSSIITFVPAIGPAQATIISNELVKTKNEKEKMITLGGVNTGDIIFSLTALFTINKSRSGVIEKISYTIINQKNYLTLILTAIITAIISYSLVNKTASWISNNIAKINYKKLNTILLIFIITIVQIISGWLGIIVLITSTLIGLLSRDYGISQTHLMNSIIIPTIIYYS